MTTPGITLEEWEVRIACLERDAIRCEHIAGDETLILNDVERDMLLRIASKLQLVADAIARRRAL